MVDFTVGLLPAGGSISIQQRNSRWIHPQESCARGAEGKSEVAGVRVVDGLGAERLGDGLRFPAQQSDEAFDP